MLVTAGILVMFVYWMFARKLDEIESLLYDIRDMVDELRPRTIAELDDYYGGDDLDLDKDYKE